MENGVYKYSTSLAKTLNIDEYDMRAVHYVESTNLGYFVVTKNKEIHRMVTVDFNSNQVTDYQISFTTQVSMDLALDNYDSSRNNIQFTPTHHLCLTGIVDGKDFSGTGVAACSHTDRR